MTVRTEINPDILPTKELQRAARKKQYEAMKAKRRAEKKSKKIAERAARQEQQRERDQELWSALQPASRLNKSRI